jgi:DNA-binding transcriptional LysR family regulator
MDLIAGLHVFIRVVETGSFSAVARETNVSQSAVTRQIAQLEEHFGVRLFHRTTRKLSLTDDGQELVTRARHLLEEAEDLEDTFGRDGASATGHVRMGLSVGAAVLLVPDVAALLRQHPGLSIELVVSEHADDLVSERLDLSLRFGQSPDTSLVSRVVATLAQHACIVHDTGPESAHWIFDGPDGMDAVDVASALRSNNALVVRQAALTGNGIALLGDALIVNDIRSGRLYRLLPAYSARRRQVHIVYPSRRHLAQRTRVVIDFLVASFKTLEDRLRDGREWGENEATWLI